MDLTPYEGKVVNAAYETPKENGSKRGVVHEQTFYDLRFEETQVTLAPLPQEAITRIKPIDDADISQTERDVLDALKGGQRTIADGRPLILQR